MLCRVMVMYVRAGRCLCGASAPSIAARVRRMNTFFISILTATSQPHTVDLRTRSQYHMSYSHNTGYAYAKASNRHATRSPRRARRHSRTARSQRASRRSAAASTGFTKRRGPCRREQTVRTDHGGALDHDAAAAPRRCWAALTAVRDAHSMCTIGREQRRQVPRSKVERRLRLAVPRIQARGDCGQRHRPSSAHAHVL